MSTRCQIIVEGCQVAIYRHSDGYPDGESGVLAMLLPLCEDFMKRRGEDPEYMAATIAWACKDVMMQYVRSRLRRIKRESKITVTDPKIVYSDQQSALSNKYLGIGLASFHDGRFHGDEEWIYVVKKNQYVEVRKTVKEFWKNPLLKFTKIHKCYRFDGKTCRPKPVPAAPKHEARASRSINI